MRIFKLLLPPIFLTSSVWAADMDFSRALSEMINANVDVRVQQTKVAAAESQLWAARGVFLPTISLQAQQQNAGGTAFSSTGIVPSTAQYYAATATWNIFKGGSDVAGLSAALFERTNEQSLLDSNYLAAEDKSAQALLDLVEGKLAVDVYLRQEESAKRFLSIAEERFNKSLLSREEMDKVALDAANAEARRADAEVQFNKSRQSVESLLGSANVQLEWPWEKRLTLNQVDDLLKAPSHQAVDSRPQHRAATASLETESARSRSLFRSMFTSVDLNYTQSRFTTSGQTIDGWSTLATLTIPLWNGYKDYSAYRVQVESKYAADARLRQTDKDIESDVTAAQSNFRVAIQQYQSRISNLNRAKHIMDQDATRFKIGRTDANELNLDLSRVTQAEILALQGIEQAHLAYMSLLHAFGQRVP